MAEHNYEQQQETQLSVLQLLPRASTSSKEKTPGLFVKSIIYSTEYSLRSGNICSLEVCIPLNFADLATSRYLSWYENSVFGWIWQCRGNQGAAWQLAPEGSFSCMRNGAHHGTKTPWPLPGEILLFLPAKQAPSICSQCIYVLPASKRKIAWISWPSPKDFQMLQSKKDIMKW